MFEISNYRCRMNKRKMGNEIYCGCRKSVQRKLLKILMSNAHLLISLILSHQSNYFLFWSICCSTLAICSMNISISWSYFIWWSNKSHRIDIHLFSHLSVESISNNVFASWDSETFSFFVFFSLKFWSARVKTQLSYRQVQFDSLWPCSMKFRCDFHKSKNDSVHSTIINNNHQLQIAIKNHILSDRK